MFKKSPIRNELELEIAARRELATQQWESTTDIEFASAVLCLIETAGEWPPGKLRPTDAISKVFHGKSDSDMAFTHFSTKFQRFYKVKLPLKIVIAELDISKATIDDFVLFLYSKVKENKSN